MEKTYKTAKEAVHALCEHLESYCNNKDKSYVKYFIDGLSTVNENNGYVETLITKTKGGWKLEIS
jgi:hypothetical protein